MGECSNAAMRDLLPDLLHDRLPAAVRAELRGHVDACADCRLELELLRRVRAATVAPRVDASRIAAALPPYRARARWRRWMESPQLRVAAAVILLVGGVAVFTFVGREPQADRTAAQTPTAGTVPVAVAPGVAPVIVGATAAMTRSASSSAPAELAVGETLNDLSDADLRALLEELGQLEAVTPAETEVVLPSLGRSGA